MLVRDLRFLIVDDMKYMRTTIKSMLRSLGFEKIEQASDGMEALRILRSHRIDIIISDWQMERMDGLELLEHIRNDRALASKPFMMITGESELRFVEKAIDSGVTEFVIKPFDPTTLSKKIKRIILNKLKHKQRIPSNEKTTEEILEEVRLGTFAG
ncbi:MAG: response regulator [Gammaproteobacteria bacterium]|nr:response regulator [Gammaproteobacteria bacterium]